jgi:fibronectin type III domain protein
MKKTPILAVIILLALSACQKSAPIQASNLEERSGHGKPQPSGGGGDIPYVTGLTVTATSSTSAVLTWTAPAGATSANSYTIVRSINLSTDFSQWLVVVPWTTYTDNSLQPNTYYSYKVSCTQNGVVGPYCAAVTVLTP